MAAQVTVYVIDACALITYLRNEPGADKMKALLGNVLNGFKMHTLNLNTQGCDEILY